MYALEAEDAFLSQIYGRFVELKYRTGRFPFALRQNADCRVSYKRRWAGDQGIGCLVFTSTEHHRVDRIGWLRAAVLGANDGILSTASLIVGVAAAAATKNAVLVAGVAGLV